ncbi:MAG: hypothetical protein AB7G28_22795 [Pirellulales bacterium]
MSELVFTAPGQAEVLAAQEAVARKGREMRSEFEEGAKATKTWTTELGSLRSAAEGGLRSIQTEQEKIAAQIGAIQEAQEKGLIPPERAEPAIRQLRERWVEVDAATVKAKEKQEEYAASQDLLKRKAESALGSVKTEMEEIEDQIADIEAAAEAGLVPPDEAEEGVRRLRERYEELKNSVETVGAEGGKLEAIFKKAFDPTIFVKWIAGMAGFKALIAAIKNEIDELQAVIDARTSYQLKQGEQSAGGIMAALAGGMLGGPAGFTPGPSPQDYQRFVNYLRVMRITGGLEQTYGGLAGIGATGTLSTEQLAGLDKIIGEIGITGLGRKALKVPYELPGTPGGIGITSSEAAQILQDLVGAVANADKNRTDSSQTNAEIIRILEAEGTQSAQHQADQIRKLDELIGVIRESGGLPVDGT